MELNETSKIGMHASFISSFFMKEPNRFFTHKQVVEKCKEAPWGEFDFIYPAIQQLLDQREIERDEAYGYCRKGQKARLRQELASPAPKMPRAEFDRLQPAEQMQFCRTGGRIT